MLWFKVARRLDLVYGGGSIGLMGLVSQAVHRGGGHVLGYCFCVFFVLFFFGFGCFLNGVLRCFYFDFWDVQDHSQDSDV